MQNILERILKRTRGTENKSKPIKKGNSIGSSSSSSFHVIFEKGNKTLSGLAVTGAF